MFWTFVATMVSGLGAAGLALGLRAITANKAPKWIIPVFAGAGMLAYLIYGEYTWYEHKKSLLPENSVIVSTESEAVLWRPWTFLKPQVTAFSVIDTQGIVRNTTDQDVVTFTLYRFEQTVSDAVSHRMHILNCASRELIPLGSDGQPRVDNMKNLAPGDALLQAVCHR